MGDMVQRRFPGNQNEAQLGITVRTIEKEQLFILSCCARICYIKASSSAYIDGNDNVSAFLTKVLCSGKRGKSATNI